MPIIDSQVHVYEANTPQRPWFRVPNWPDHVTGDEMVAAMDKVGVDGAIFISSFSMYQYDASYAVEVYKAHPGRFALVKPVNPDDPAVADVIGEWKKTPGAVGIRIMLPKEGKRAADDPGLDRILRAAVKYDFPVNMLAWGNIDVGTAVIAIPTRASSSTISASSSRARPKHAPRSPGPTCQRCWISPSARTRCSRSAVPARCRKNRIPSRTSGTRFAASSTPGDSSAACGARIGPAPSRASTTNRPSSLSLKPTA